jgi:hypothetical protein
MENKYLSFVLVAILVVYSCGKSNNNPEDITNQIDTQSYTSTSVTGTSLGLIDPTDWTRDNIWLPQETILFQAPTSTQLANTSDSGTVLIFPAYPNPLNNIFNWGYRTTKTSLLQIVITDNQLNIKKRLFINNTLVGNNTISIQMPESEFEQNKNYRLYYAFYTSNNGLYYKGHGDLAVRR